MTVSFLKMPHSYGWFGFLTKAVRRRFLPSFQMEPRAWVNAPQENEALLQGAFLESSLVCQWRGRAAQVLSAGVLLTHAFLDVAAALRWLPLTCMFAQILSVPSVRVDSLFSPLPQPACPTH